MRKPKHRQRTKRITGYFEYRRKLRSIVKWAAWQHANFTAFSGLVSWASGAFNPNDTGAR